MSGTRENMALFMKVRVEALLRKLLSGKLSRRCIVMILRLMSLPQRMCVESRKNAMPHMK